MKVKIGIIGLFGGGKPCYDGQTIKTNIVTREIEKTLGKEQVSRVDTYGWKKNPFNLLVKSILTVWNSQNVLFMTDQGGIKVFPWLLLASNCFFKRKLHYVVIGGWLVPFLRNHAFLKSCLKKMDNIFVETSKMKAGLEELGFKNVVLLQNFKDLVPLSEDELIYIDKEPYPFCTFSRVMKEKGIEDAVNAIKNINNHYGRPVCTLDIYGAVDVTQTVWFENLSTQFSEEICYRGTVPFDKSVDVIKKYHMLLFPTHYITEGIPGTIIDAYAAGVPVIASQWDGFNDIIDDGNTGIGYSGSHNEILPKVIQDSIQFPARIHAMKKKCLKKAILYLPENSISGLLEKMQ